MHHATHRFSRIAATLYVGVDFFHRAGLSRDDVPAPRGLVDRFEQLCPPSLDTARLPASVRAFFEDTASLDLHIRTRWHPLARLFWTVGRLVMRAVGQLCLPLDTAHVRTKMIALDGAREGRDDVRGVVRSTVDDGRVFQVFAYGVTEAMMSVAIPLPLGHLAGLLRVELSGDGRAVTLTSQRDDGALPTGVWYVTRYFALPMPLGETLRFWSADDPDAPIAAGDRAWPDATLVALHTQTLFGLTVVKHTYTFRPLREALTEVDR